PPPPSPLFPYTTLFRSLADLVHPEVLRDPADEPHPEPDGQEQQPDVHQPAAQQQPGLGLRLPLLPTGHDGPPRWDRIVPPPMLRSEEHTSELQSRGHLV